MILADENISGKTIESLRSAGVSVFSIFEEMAGITDEEIIKLSLAIPKKIILTCDKDFGEWVFSHQQTKISVIFLRYRFGDLDTVNKVLNQLVLEKGSQLFGNFTTISKSKIRITPLR